MTNNRTINMSEEEIKRCEILRMADEKRIIQKEGAKRLGISPVISGAYCENIEKEVQPGFFSTFDASSATL